MRYPWILNSVCIQTLIQLKNPFQCQIGNLNSLLLSTASRQLALQAIRQILIYVDFDLGLQRRINDLNSLLSSTASRQSLC